MTTNLVDELLSELNRSTMPQHPGDVFCDGKRYPEMVLVAAGKHGDIEIEQFLLSKTPAKPDDWYKLFGFNSDRQVRVNTPEYGEVLHMTGMDAYEYAERLRMYTGQGYRLPTPSELEYAIGPGSIQTCYWLYQDDDEEWQFPGQSMPDLTAVFVVLDLPAPDPNDPEGHSIRKFILGEVDASAEHVVMSYGDLSREDEVFLDCVARIGKPVDGTVVIQLFLDEDNLLYAEIIENLFSDLKIVFTRLNVNDVWKYAIYQSERFGNVYGRLHWGYFDGKNES